MYLSIPYIQDTSENYLEYNSSFMDESSNKSLTNVSKSYFQEPRKVAVYYDTNKVVNANDKFVYGIDLKNIGKSVDNNGGASSLNKIFVKKIQVDEVYYDGSTGIMYYKEKISNTSYIVPASLLQRKVDGSDKLMFETELSKYTLSAAISAIKSSDPELKEAYDKIIIYKTNIDTVAADHRCYNITSRNIIQGASANDLGMKGVDPNEIFSAVTETSVFLETEENSSIDKLYYRLAKDLFEITINSCYVINSSAFTTKSNKISAFVDGAPDEGKTFASGLYTETTTNGRSIVATLKIYYENGSVPDVVIRQKSPKLDSENNENNQTKNPDILNAVGIKTDYGYNNTKNALEYKPSGMGESYGTKSDPTINDSSDAYYFTRDGKDVQGYFSNVFSAGYEM